MLKNMGEAMFAIVFVPFLLAADPVNNEQPSEPNEESGSLLNQGKAEEVEAVSQETETEEKQSESSTAEESFEVVGEELEVELCDEECERARLEKLKENWRKIPEEAHIEQVSDLQRSGNFISATQRLSFLVEEFGTSEYRYLWILNIELQEQYDDALVLYDELRSEELDPELDLQIAFRQAIVLDDLKRYAEAHAAFKELKRSKSLNYGDRDRINLLFGASLIHAGHPRRGVRKIARTLAKPELSNSTWMRARAHDALAHELIRRSEELVFIGSDKKDKKAVLKRMELLKRAEEQVIASIQLNEPEFVLLGLIDIADAYVRLYDDLITAPPPKSLTESQKKEYTQQLNEEALVLLKRALGYCEKGLIYADQVGWVGLAVEALKSRVASLSRDLE